MNVKGKSPACLKLLSEVLLGRGEDASNSADTLNNENWERLWGLANSHHVTMRSFPELQRLVVEKGNARWAAWVDHSFKRERARIQHAISFLSPIVNALDQCGKVVVIKSFDHWPDLGSDLDLYIDADPVDVVAIMRKTFRANVEQRSWGDRLAHKWNFSVPWLPELVEIHIGRLGQTGEQTAITESLVARAQSMQLGACEFQVPAPEDRLIIGTLQRMYRHFYFRLCDIVDTAQLAETEGTIDYSYLRTLAQSAGVWEGLATYLVIVSDYVKAYRGVGVSLPSWVQSAARFGGDQLCFRRNWLRIPLVPQSAGLYAAEWKNLLWQGDIRNALRLSLLPGLATAAALGQKITGSDKGIW